MKRITKERVKKFWNDYQEEILIGVSSVISITAVFILTKKELKKIVKDIDLSPGKPLAKLNIPRSVALVGVEEISSSDFDEYADIWLHNTSFKDLGDFGKALVETYGWDPDSSITGVVSTGFVAGD